MKTIILRFRDLTIPAGETIRRHREKIRAQGSAWWGWMARQREKFPEQSLSELASATHEAKNGVEIFLYHSGECQFYPSTLLDISAYPGGAYISTPEVQKTPSYMSEAECPAWFKIACISDPRPKLPTPMALGMPTLETRSPVDDDLLKNPVHNGEDLRHSAATLWEVVRRRT